MHDDEIKRKIQRLKDLEQIKAVYERKDALVNAKFLPSQAKLFKYGINNPKISISIFTGPNQTGKTHVLCADLAADFKGFQPWDKKPRKFKPPVKIALLLTDFDNAAKTVYEKLEELLPPDELKVEERTQQYAPRVIRHLPTNSVAHVFTHDQEVRKLRGGTWHGLKVDEPAPRSHFIELYRGVQKTRGKVLFTLTPLSEPWIFDEYYSEAGNLGGTKKHIYAVTAWPDENLQSQGGHLDDQAVKEFREALTEEEKQARVHGQWLHLIGRIHPAFDERVHVISEHFIDPSLCPMGVSIDPHDRRPFAIAWYYITPGDDIVFCDEWPREPFHKLRDCDLDFSDYAEILRDHGRVHLGVIDPNYGNRRSAQTGMSVEEALRLACHDIGYSLPLNPEVVDDLTLGHKAVNEYLKYNKEKPLGPLNKPKLFVMKHCHNIIKSFRNYTWDEWKGRMGEGKGPKQKPKEEYKDFADLVRYAVVDDPRYFNPVTYDAPPQVFEPSLRPGWELTKADQEWINARLRR